MTSSILSLIIHILICTYSVVAAFKTPNVTSSVIWAFGGGMWFMQVLYKLLDVVHRIFVRGGED